MAKKNINDVLDGIGKTEPISYVEQMTILVADYHGSQVGQDHEIVQSMLRSARAVGYMRGMDAREAWFRKRDDAPWWKRPFISKDAPDSFITEYVQHQQQRAKDRFVQALKDLHGPN